MLILRRRIGERIVIDGRIEITVLHIRGGKVRLGFTHRGTFGLSARKYCDLRRRTVRPI
jgi:hypothetical protein